MNFEDINIFSKEGLLTIGVICVVIYILVKLFNAQQLTIEGLTNKQSSQPPIMEIAAQGNLKDLKKTIQQLDDAIRLDKYKPDYEDVLIDLDEIINQQLLAQIVFVGNGIVNNNMKPSDQQFNAKQMEHMKQLYDLKQILESTMQYLDGKSGSSLGKTGGLF